MAVIPKWRITSGNFEAVSFEERGHWSDAEKRYCTMLAYKGDDFRVGGILVREEELSKLEAVVRENFKAKGVPERLYAESLDTDALSKLGTELRTVIDDYLKTGRGIEAWTRERLSRKPEMTATLYHTDILPLDQLIQRPRFPEDYAEVARLHVKALPADAPREELTSLCHEVFGRTNHLEGDWRQNPGVRVSTDREFVRSTSVNDVVVLSNGRGFRFEAFGFSELSELELSKCERPEQGNPIKRGPKLGL
jgi:hypothetical protein